MSIIKKIVILFAISGALVLIIGLYAVNINEKRELELTKEKYLNISKELITFIDSPRDIDEIIEKNNLIKIRRDRNIDELILERNYSFGSIKIFQYTYETYLKIDYLGESLLLKEKEYYFLNDKNVLLMLLILNITILYIIFLYIINLLAPLKETSEHIKRFADGDFSTRIKVKSKDIISDFGDSFNAMAEKIEDLIKRREELLRDVSHELKTPISKGNFVIEKIEASKEKESLKKVFKNLETLTTGLIELDRLSVNYLEKKKFDVETLIAQALSDLYIFDEDKISIDIQKSFIINGDLYYLTMALKNLIENAIKYTNTYPIKIEVSLNKIAVISSGDKLNEDLEHYMNAFTQENECDKKKGFGLGLSIVKKVLKKHEYSLEYKYIQGNNCFSIVMK